MPTGRAGRASVSAASGAGDSEACLVEQLGRSGAPAPWLGTTRMSLDEVGGEVAVAFLKGTRERRIVMPGGWKRQDMQRWIVDTWINNCWLPAHALVMSDPHGSLGEAFVVARIWNSGSGLARQAVSAAAGTSDPGRRVKLVLDNYCARTTTYAGRHGVMQRPLAVYRRLAATA
jgi:hypothetical protein